MSVAFPESRVVRIWQDYLPGRSDLVTEDDGPVKVVYPGRPNDDRGADLRDAVIVTGRGTVRGDIEVHVKSSSWWTHGHHHDPAYNRVILHVVFWHDVAKTIVLQNGRAVPTLALHKFVGEQVGRHVVPAGRAAMWRAPCREAVRRRDTGFMSGVLDNAGEQRFLSRAADLREALSRKEPGQSLYQAIMVALGYARNKQPMEELSRRVPLSRLGAAVSGETVDEACLARYQARLLGMAGLLPSQRAGQYHESGLNDDWVDRLERLWSASGETAAMSAEDWNFFKVRPGNFPTRRIAAMSYLLLRYREGLLPGLMKQLDEAMAIKNYRELELALLVPAEGYWARHLDFGRPGGGANLALLGRGRAADIVVNVMLPFAAAWGECASRPELAAGAREIYRDYPVLAENTLEKHMRRQLGINRHIISSARRQQGLLHIYKNLCSQGRCQECPVAQ